MAPHQAPAKSGPERTARVVGTFERDVVPALKIEAKSVVVDVFVVVERRRNRRIDSAQIKPSTASTTTSTDIVRTRHGAGC